MLSALSRSATLRTLIGVLIATGAHGLSSRLTAGQTSSPANPARGAGSGVCGIADPAYIRVANETGGIPLFLERSEAAKTFHFVRESSRNNMALVFWATGVLDGNGQAIEIPVDSLTGRITFTFSVATRDTRLTLRKPSDEIITEQSKETEITELNCGRIVTVVSPESGIWRAEISGRGTFWLEAQAQSDIQFISVKFVKEGGRPGHEGLFPISGQPLAGAPATLEASLSAAATETTEFHLVSEDGKIIQTIDMRPVNSDREFLELVGALDLPKVPFRVSVTGRDSAGVQYQRFFPGLFHAESVEVSAESSFEELPAGTTMRAAFKVRNVGPPGTFKITATDARKFVTALEPQQLSLDANGLGTIGVELTVPAGTVPGVGDDVVVVAAGTSRPATSNSCVVHVSVSRPGAKPDSP